MKKITREQLERQVKNKLILRIILMLVLEALGFLFMKVYGQNYFDTRLGGSNSATAYIVLAILPFFLSGLPFYLFDRSWEGTILKITPLIITKAPSEDTEFTRAEQRAKYTVYVTIQTPAGTHEEKKIGTLVDATLDKLAVGDRITHYRATKLYWIEPVSQANPSYVLERL